MYKNLFIPLLFAAALFSSCEQKPVEKAAEPENEVVQTIMERRSIRKYESNPVSQEQMEEIIRCGINAPNGMGRESWEVRVITKPELLHRLDSLYGDFMMKEKGERPQYAAYGAPALVFIAYDTRYDLSQVDCGLLGGNMILAAQSMDLGSCCLGGICRFLKSPEGSEFMDMLDFPESHELLYAIAFGHPAESPKAKPRTPERVRFIE